MNRVIKPFHIHWLYIFLKSFKKKPSGWLCLINLNYNRLYIHLAAYLIRSIYQTLRETVGRSIYFGLSL